MTPPDRIRRPRPERKAPLRGGWLSLFGPPPPPGSSGDATPEGDGATPGGDDAVSRAVDLGYRVVDEYMRQGQRTARLMARRAYGPQAMASDVQEMTARAVQYGAELMDVWVGLLGQAAAAPADFGPAYGDGGDPADPAEGRDGALRPRGGPPRPTPPATRVVLAVASERPVQIQLDVEGAEGRSLEVQDLQCTAGEGVPPLRGATLSGKPACLRLRVPPDQPEGLYAGLVLDARTRAVAGTLVVSVGEDGPGDASGDA